MLFKFTPAFVVTNPAALDFTFAVSTHDEPFQRNVLSVAVPFVSTLPVVQVGVAPSQALCQYYPVVTAARLDLRRLCTWFRCR